MTVSDNITVVPEPKPEYIALFGTSGLTASIGLMESAKLVKGETVRIKYQLFAIKNRITYQRL